MNTNSVVVLVGPSGVGKDTLIDLIVARSEYCRFPVYTTRLVRDGEIDGVHYNFISHTHFAQLFDNNSLLERFEVEGNFYGLCLDDLKIALAKNKKLITHMSIEGLVKLKESGVKLTSIWIQSPYPGAVMKRLRKRGLSEKEIVTRINHESTEEKFESLFDHTIVNHDYQQEQVAISIINFLNKK